MHGEHQGEYALLYQGFKGLECQGRNLPLFLFPLVYCPVAFTSTITLTNVIHKLRDNIHTAQRNNQHQRKIGLLNFRLNGHL